MQRSKLDGSAHRQNWLKELKSLGLHPDMVLVAKRETRDEAQQAEREMIARYLALGCDLTNGTPGGDGGPTNKGRKRSAEAIEKTASAHRGMKHDLSPAIRKALADSASMRFKGRPLSEEHRKKIGRASKGRTVSPEQRKRQGDALRGVNKGRSWRLVNGKREWLDVPAGPKTCSRCGSLGPFYKCASTRPTRDGLTTACRKCINDDHRKKPCTSIVQLSLF